MLLDRFCWFSLSKQSRVGQILFFILFFFLFYCAIVLIINYVLIMASNFLDPSFRRFFLLVFNENFM